MKARRVRVLKTNGDTREYESAKACAKGEHINLFTVYNIITRGYNNHGDKYEYVRS